jgi:hypothetical protein
MRIEATRSFETSIFTRHTRRQIPEDGILHSHRCENLKSCISKVIRNLINKNVFLLEFLRTKWCHSPLSWILDLHLFACLYITLKSKIYKTSEVQPFSDVRAVFFSVCHKIKISSKLSKKKHRNKLAYSSQSGRWLFTVRAVQIKENILKLPLTCQVSLRLIWIMVISLMGWRAFYVHLIQLLWYATVLWGLVYFNI